MAEIWFENQNVNSLVFLIFFILVKIKKMSGKYFKLPNPFLKGLNRKWLKSGLKIKMLTVWVFFCFYFSEDKKDEW